MIVAITTVRRRQVAMIHIATGAWREYDGGQGGHAGVLFVFNFLAFPAALATVSAPAGFLFAQRPRAFDEVRLRLFKRQ